MKILFVVGHIYLPQSYGGVQTSTDQLCRELKRRGHEVAVLTCIRHGGWFAWKCLAKMKIYRLFTGHKITRDKIHGYAVWRAWFPSRELGYAVKMEKPDLIVIMTGEIVPIANETRRIGIPVLVQLNDVVFGIQGGDLRTIGEVPCVANSRFTAETYQRQFGINSTVIYPFVSTDKYHVNSSRENVTFINPIGEKGSDIALEIARLCPEIPFTFVECWHRPEERRVLLQKLSALPNVTFLPPQEDMRKIYGKCKILLAPSLVEEAFGRIVTEAHVSGIPVIASRRGGLPEAVGPGGILLYPEGPIDAWVEAVRKLWNDEKYYAELSVAALAYSQRAEMNPDFQITAHEKALLAAAGKKAA